MSIFGKMKRGLARTCLPLTLALTASTPAPGHAQPASVELVSEIDFTIHCLVENPTEGWHRIGGSPYLFSDSGQQTYNLHARRPIDELANDNRHTFLITVKNSPCHYTFNSYGRASVFHPRDINHPAPLLEIDGHRYLRVFDLGSQTRIVRALFAECRLDSNLFRIGGHNSTPEQRKQRTEEQCNDDINHILLFNSVNVSLFTKPGLIHRDGPNLALVRGRAYLDGRPLQSW